MFNLDQAITEWRRQMSVGGVKNPAVLDELESHLREEIERQTRSGLAELNAFEMAAKKIGASHLLKAEFAKIRPLREFSLGPLVGGACCVTAALYSMVLASALITVPKLGSGQRFSGLVALCLTLFFLASLRFSHRYLPVIRNLRARFLSVSACAAAGFLWLFIFSRLLPNIIVPHFMSRVETERPAAEHLASGGFVPPALQGYNQPSPNFHVAQPGYIDPPPITTAIFNIGISLFWAMTLGAGVGSLAYGLEEAAKRRSTELAYV